MRKLGWEVLMHLTYSPKFGPSDCRLFWFLKNSVNGLKLDLKETCEIFLVQVFAEKTQKCSMTE